MILSHRLLFLLSFGHFLPGITATPQHHAVRGVNLGGWLLLEPFITPTIFETAQQFHPSDGRLVVDEWTLCEKLGRNECQRRVEEHYRTFITEADFAEIKQFGLQIVRIPIGYWSIHPKADDVFAQGSLEYFRLALSWAKKHGLQVILDLHGAPGSQNGHDHSGRSGELNWIKNQDNIHWTLATIQKLAEEFVGDPRWKYTLTGFGILNEPYGNIHNIAEHEARLHSFTDEAYRIIRTFSSSIDIIISPSEMSPPMWRQYLRNHYSTDFHGNAIIDLHPYLAFGSHESQLAMLHNPVLRKNAACGFRAYVLDFSEIGKVMVGEWSAAVTDCAKYLRGVLATSEVSRVLYREPSQGQCARLGSGKVAELTQGERDLLKAVINEQLTAFNYASAWYFWTWKTEAASEWCMQDLLRNGLFPEQFVPAPGVCIL